MAQPGQQHGLYVTRGFHLDGEVLSDVSALEWRYCLLPQQVPRMELPENISLNSVRNITHLKNCSIHWKLLGQKKEIVWRHTNKDDCSLYEQGKKKFENYIPDII
jgi:hypothetical protein